MKCEMSKIPFSETIKKQIYNCFSSHSVKTIGTDGLRDEPIVFQLSENDQIAGLAVVQIFWGQLHIKHLAVEEKYRGKGYGKKLMQHALEYGKERGCNFAFVETMNFQAPLFYQKLGFEVEFCREGYERKSSLVYLKKNLDVEEKMTYV
jgi:ribosomal protein S18 acetylase RimI-like enzyme